AAQRADRGGSIEAGVPRQGHRRQPRRRVESRHAGRSGDSVCPVKPSPPSPLSTQQTFSRPANSASSAVAFEMSSIITFDRVAKRYGSAVAVRSVSLSVERGEMFGLIGPDGAGKTTTIRLMCGLLRPDEGRATVLDLDPSRDHRKLTASVGYLSQRFSLYGD